MAKSTPLVNGHENAEDHSPDPGLANLSLSSRTVHADDYLNKSRDVAPALHVSTTFRYNSDPDQLKVHRGEDVSPTPPYLSFRANQLINS
jgi:cystathionine beta-lyase/cystathionine gamma-synthase